MEKENPAKAKTTGPQSAYRENLKKPKKVKRSGGGEKPQKKKVDHAQEKKRIQGSGGTIERKVLLASQEK